MKKAFLILSLVFLFGCVTKRETYLIIASEDKILVEPKQNKEYALSNRFEKQFNQADSVFMVKLKEASRQAAEEATEQINKQYKK